MIHLMGTQKVHIITTGPALPDMMGVFCVKILSTELDILSSDDTPTMIYTLGGRHHPTANIQNQHVIKVAYITVCIS